MASFEQMSAVPSGLTVDELAGTVCKISKELNWLLRNLDDLNISSLSADKITAGTIDADEINVINLDAANIKADTVMANVDLTIGVGDAVFKADDNGIYLGNADFNDAPFSVDMAGNLVATNATITGDIISSDIQGGTITIGDTYKTTIFSLDGAGVYALFDSKGNLLGYLRYNGSYVELRSVNGKQLQLISDEDIFLNANGIVSIGGHGISLMPSVGNIAEYFDGSSNTEIATKGWVNSQGYITGVSGASGSFTTADGKTVTVSDGLITSIA
jgi:hypothetical protein